MQTLHDDVRIEIIIQRMYARSLTIIYLLRRTTYYKKRRYTRSTFLDTDGTYKLLYKKYYTFERENIFFYKYDNASIYIL